MQFNSLPGDRELLFRDLACVADLSNNKDTQPAMIGLALASNFYTLGGVRCLWLTLQIVSVRKS
jgi:hypothetical protein